MCGRYALKRQDLEALLQRLGVGPPRTFASRYNIAPGTTVPTLRIAPSTGRREPAGLHWGLVPSWARDTRDSARMANARAESIAVKPAFRAAFQFRRGVVPASGFYEWQAVGRLKQPWYFERVDGKPFVFASLWETWRGADGAELESCTLVTTTPNATVRPLHDRMPVILHGAAVDRWLDPAVSDPALLAPLLQPLPAAELKATPVAPRVNSVRNEGPDLILPAPPLRADPPQLSLEFE